MIVISAVGQVKGRHFHLLTCLLLKKNTACYHETNNSHCCMTTIYYILFYFTSGKDYIAISMFSVFSESK